MEVKTYRASTMQDALQMVRNDLGPGAAVLHMREVPLSRLLGWLPGMRQIEVTASAEVLVASRFAESTIDECEAVSAFDARRPSIPLAPEDMSARLAELQSMVTDLCRQKPGVGPRDVPEALFGVYTALVDAEIGEDLAREMIERVQSDFGSTPASEPSLILERLAESLEREIQIAAPIDLDGGHSRVVALVGPTGVGKTTTIAKLAANYRLRDKRNVGLITVDTYRIAAVEQLRTYADIIDLPMEVVSSQREMRDAVARMSHLDLVLIDTAGRSPKDEVKIRELRALLAEARADEVHLVLSSVASASSLLNTAERFAASGATSLVLTKLDEAATLGNLLPVLRQSGLKVSYLTNGQNVPDDIQPAQAGRLARAVLGLEESR